jgi:hypothetical protein
VGGSLADQWQTFLHPVCYGIASADVKEHACGKPPDEYNEREKQERTARFRRDEQSHG